MGVSRRISRRTVLRGLGATVALPWLETMGPVAAWADDQPDARKAPNRLAFIYVPNGKNMADWTPAAEGTDFELPAILQPLQNLRGDFSVLTGLTADKARPNGDGGGDHARAISAFLTGVQPFKTDGTDIRAAVSADQVAASRVGVHTRLPSLEIGCEQGGAAGNCDSGYSCVYSGAMSWRSATQPLPKEVNPRLVFERLFSGEPAAARVLRDRTRRSILDVVLEDANDLSGKVTAADRRKLDEYFSSIRDIEQRIERASRLPEVKPPDYAKPDGVPSDYPEHVRLMCDLLVLAFQADVTRVATFVMANEGSTKPYPFIGVPDGHHDLSHHGNDEAKKAKIREINKFHVSQFAYLLEKLKAVPEGAGTLLNHCMIAYGSGNSDGNAHNHDNLPILLAGRGGGSITTGRHVRYPAETPLNNLWMAMLDRADVRLPFLGDSTGTLSGLA